MMSGIMRSTSVVIGGNTGPTNNGCVSTSPTSASPLQIFVKAKKRINDIYSEVDIYINDSAKFLHGALFCLYLLYQMQILPTIVTKVYPKMAI